MDMDRMQGQGVPSTPGPSQAGPMPHTRASPRHAFGGFIHRLKKTKGTGPPSSSRRGMSFVRQRSNSAGPIDLPQMIPCVADCGFFGSSQTMNLCSRCYTGLCHKARTIRDRDAIQQLLDVAGFPSLVEFKRHMAFQKHYPQATSGTERDTTPGVTLWQTTLHPLSQFDKIPQRGNSACTYIAGVTALRFALREEIPTAETWADSIARGVKAYHNAMSAGTVAENHADISEAFPFILPTLGIAADKNLVDITTTVVTLLRPDGISDEDFRVVIGPEGYPECSKQGLINCFMQAFSDSISSTCSDATETGAVSAHEVEDGFEVIDAVDGHRSMVTEEREDDRDARPCSADRENVQRADQGAQLRAENIPDASPVPVRQECAMVITRPPETYCVLKSSDGKVYWRDSHRRKQYDFESTDAFRRWLEADGIFTVPLKGCPLAMNQVAISSISPTVAAHIADGMSVLV